VLAKAKNHLHRLRPTNISLCQRGEGKNQFGIFK